jgi:hypothetical protein
VARFELLAPHILVLGGISQQVQRGAIIDSGEVENFSATPAMKALDAEGYAMLRAVCTEIRAVQQWAGRRPDVNCPGFGHSGCWPGGELAPPWTPPDAPLAWARKD